MCSTPTVGKRYTAPSRLKRTQKCFPSCPTPAMFEEPVTGRKAGTVTRARRSTPKPTTPIAPKPSPVGKTCSKHNQPATPPTSQKASAIKFSHPRKSENPSPRGINATENMQYAENACCTPTNATTLSKHLPNSWTAFYLRGGSNNLGAPPCREEPGGWGGRGRARCSRRGGRPCASPCLPLPGRRPLAHEGNAVSLAPAPLSDHRIRPSR